MADVKLAGGISVESADNIEERGFSASGLTEDGDELVLSEGDRDTVQRGNVTGWVDFCDVFELKHFVWYLPFFPVIPN